MPSETAAPDRVEEEPITDEAVSALIGELDSMAEWFHAASVNAFMEGDERESDLRAAVRDRTMRAARSLESLRTQLQEARQDRDGNSFAAEMELLQDEHDRLDPIVKLVVKKDYDRTGSEWVEVVNPWETLSALLDRRDSDHQAWLRSSTPLSE